MLIIPAIDLKDGCVVRLVQGNFGEKKVYSKDPVKTARHWVTQGAELLHIVDLDGASTGVPKNLGAVKEIVKDSAVPVQFGGGVREIETIKTLIEAGVFRVVLGTKAAEDRSFLLEAFEKFKERIIVSIDAKDEKVLIKGWLESSSCVSAKALARDLKDIGFTQLIYTDISKDGTLKGPNIKGIKELLKETSMKVISSGGISTLDDIRRLKQLEVEGVAGIIVGKALYEGKFTLKQALKLP
jgi:phosphoribosylformimino-5-aminoimidazole carboxamide ribotide isomerase